MGLVPKSKADLLVLYANNTDGDISPEDLRYLVETTIPPVTTITGSTRLVQDSDNVIMVNYAGACTVTLQTDQVVDGRRIEIGDISGACSTNNITIATQASETINGAATLVLNTDYANVTLACNGTNWFVR